MKITASSRLNGIGEYYFSKKLKEIEDLNKQGKDVINLGIGSPDMPPHPDVITELSATAEKTNVHGYQSYRGSEILRKAIASWYDEWYDVKLDHVSEILPLIGSKEGIMHICMTYLNAGDEVLIPNPGYPTYNTCVRLAGGVPVEYELKEENGWFPDLEALEDLGIEQVKMMWVNYPHMPTGKLPTVEFFEKLVAFGKRNNILICHDNPYSFILNDKPLSILSVAGAKEVCVELNSLSKSLNMAGWRVGMLCGSAERINEILVFKSNMDSGMFLPVQLAAAKALSLAKDWYDELNYKYAQRREKVYELLDLLKVDYSKTQVGLFVWGKIPVEYESGYALSDKILYECSVFITPGGIFGSAGDKYVRVSLCATVEKLAVAQHRISSRYPMFKQIVL